MSAADNFPNWVMLDRFVFIRDDEESFLDVRTAPIRASGVTFWGAPFSVAFELAKAPEISRMYAQFRGFPDPSEQIAILATHHHLILFRVSLLDHTRELLQHFFIFNASNPVCSLISLPRCTLPDLRRHPRPPSGVKYIRVMTVASMGVLSRGEGEGDFAVAELNLYYPDGPSVVADRSKVRADMFWLLSSCEPRSDDVVRWKSARLVVSSDKSDLIWSDFDWGTDRVIAAHDCLCWICYDRGIISCNLFQEMPTLSFTGFPPDEFSLAEDPIIASCLFYCGASAIEAGHALKIVRVIRHDGRRYGQLEVDKGFTITCHTYLLDTGTGTIGWSRDYIQDYMVTSKDLWSVNPREKLPRKILMFPEINIDRPHVVQFLVIDDFRLVMKKMSVVTIDMNTRIAESCVPYINGREDIGTKYADLMERMSSGPRSFIPSDFSKFSNISRRQGLVGARAEVRGTGPPATTDYLGELVSESVPGFHGCQNM